MEHRKINDNYRKIAEALIETEPELSYIKNSQVKITYLESDSTKKADKDKLVLGECEKVAAKNRWAITSDFTITLYANVKRNAYTFIIKSNAKKFMLASVGRLKV